MKPTITFLLSFVVLIVCLSPGLNGQKNAPKKKKCTPCSDAACKFIAKALKYLESKIRVYREIVNERCLCIQGDQDIPNPKNFVVAASVSANSLTAHAPDTCDVTSPEAVEFFDGIFDGFDENDLISLIEKTSLVFVDNDCQTNDDEAVCNPVQIFGP